MGTISAALKNWSVWPLWALVVTLSGGAVAHEVEETRATLVLRDQRHVSLSLYLNPARVAHQLLSPEQPWRSFLGVMAAMPLEVFAGNWAKVVRMTETEFLIQNGKAAPQRLSGWQWPAIAQVHNQIRQQAMASIAIPNQAAHEEPIEVRAQFQAAQPLERPTIRAPRVLRPITLVASRPVQFRMDEKSDQIRVSFQPD